MFQKGRYRIAEAQLLALNSNNIQDKAKYYALLGYSLWLSFADIAAIQIEELEEKEKMKQLNILIEQLNWMKVLANISSLITLLFLNHSMDYGNILIIWT